MARSMTTEVRVLVGVREDCRRTGIRVAVAQLAPVGGGGHASVA
jgi:hypothetical protein